MSIADELKSVPGRIAETPSNLWRSRETARRAAKAGFTAGRTVERGRNAATSSNGHLLEGATFAIGAIVGIGAGFLLDPQNGKRRRHVLRDKAFSFARKGKQETERKARYAAGVAEGAVAEATPSPRDPEELNDPALARKVESEIFRGADAPKGKVNVNVENGVVVLRGKLDDPNEVEALIANAQRVEGVRDVDSHLTLA